MYEVRLAAKHLETDKVGQNQPTPAHGYDLTWTPLSQTSLFFSKRSAALIDDSEKCICWLNL